MLIIHTENLIPHTRMESCQIFMWVPKKVLEQEMATHSSIVWRIPWTEEPDRQ